MANGVSLVFPHQLFSNHPAIDKKRPVYLSEEWLFFRQYRFHQQKLVLHRASMRYYHDRLLQQGHTVHYIATHQPENDCRELLAGLAAAGIAELHLAHPTDDWLLQRLQKAAARYGMALQLYDSPNFLNTPQSTAAFFNGRKTYFQTDFYTWQRKQRKILLQTDGKPVGGKWTFDSDNREKFPKGQPVPPLPLPPDNEYLAEARLYVQQHFGHHYGNANTPHLFAVTHKDAGQWLADFIGHRLAGFGPFEDAIVAKETVLHHSVLTPMLNIGLLQPQQVLDQVLQAAARQQVPLNSLEGFVRQVMGWREFIYLVYHREGRRQRTTNYWQFSRKLPASFWTGQTGIPPIDTTIKKILNTGYCHHIERLMVLGNFMLLCEFDPDEVYRWFMEMFTDAYDWVMVPNVYGMTQFADGGLMTTKPYIGGSNYLMKMGDYAKGPWQAVWDGLFWRFMHVHRSFFLQNPRLGMLVNMFDKMPPEKRAAHLANADGFLQKLDAQQPVQNTHAK
jgi:deoxyribodipyrimidine photolyase-related protein